MDDRWNQDMIQVGFDPGCPKTALQLNVWSMFSTVPARNCGKWSLIFLVIDRCIAEADISANHCFFLFLLSFFLSFFILFFLLSISFVLSFFRISSSSFFSFWLYVWIASYFFYLEPLRASQTRSCCLKSVICKSVIYFTHTFYQVQIFLIVIHFHIFYYLIF